MKHISILSVLVALSLFAALALLPVSVQAHEEVDFNDRFAVQTTGARGEIEFDDDQEGSFIEISEIEVEDLLPDHAYEIWVTVSDPATPFVLVIPAQQFGPFVSDEDGELEVEELEVSVPGPGTYRVDVFLTHIHSTTCPSAGFGAFLCGLLGTVEDPTRDILLACQPALIITLEADDDEDFDDD